MGHPTAQKKTRNEFGLQRPPQAFVSLDQVAGMAETSGAKVQTTLQAGTNNVQKIALAKDGVVVPLAVKRGTNSNFLYEVKIAADSVRGAFRKVGALRPNAGSKHGPFLTATA